MNLIESTHALEISIHALREEGDQLQDKKLR